MVFFASTVFGVACSDATLNVSISSPLNDLTIYENQSFTFTAILAASLACDTDLNFLYDRGLGGAFYRIEEPFYQPGVHDLNSNDATYRNPVVVALEGGSAPEKELPIIYFNDSTIFFGASVTVPITVKCNKKGSNPTGDYILMLAANYPGPVYSAPITIHCLANDTNPPTGNFVNPSVPSVGYGSSYNVEWDAFDIEGSPLTYDLSWAGASSGSVLGLTQKYYKVASLIPGDYVFTLKISDGFNPKVEVKSSTLTLVQQPNTLSISDFTVSPDVIYGNGTIDVNLTVRNNSSDAVDLNVFFYNNNFSPNPVRKSIPLLAPYSKTSFSTHQNFSGIAVGDYTVTVRIKESVIGNPNIRTDTNYYVHFTVLADQKSISAPETRPLIAVLIALSVVLIARRKN